MSYPDPLSLGFWAVLVLGVLMIIFLGLFVFTAWADPRPQFEGNWGGLGGGLGGWRISTSIVYLALAVAMGIMGTTIATSLINRRPPTIAAVDKYQSVVRLMALSNVRLIETYEERDHKVVIKGLAPDEATKTRIWDQIKLVNPTLEDLVVDINVVPTPKP